MERAEREGYLEKEGGTVKNWKIRWFSLIQTTLYYYKNRKESKPLGEIELKDCQVVIIDDFYRKRKLEFLFQLKLPKRTYNIIAPDYDTRQAWVDAILAKIPNQSEPITRAFSPVSSPDVMSDHSESEAEDSSKQKNSSTYSELKKLVEVSCMKTRSALQELLNASPFTLVEATRKFTLNVNPLFSSVFQLISVEEDEEKKSIYLTNIATLEMVLKDLIAAAKEYAIEGCYGKKEIADEARTHLGEGGAEFLSIMENIQPSRKGSGGSSHKKKNDFRSSVMLAKQTLDFAISDIQQTAQSGQQKSQTDNMSSLPPPSSMLPPSLGVQDKGLRDLRSQSAQFYNAFDEIYDAIAQEGDDDSDDDD